MSKERGQAIPKNITVTIIELLVTKWVEIIFSYFSEHGPCQDFLQTEINISQISSIRYVPIIIRGKNIWPHCGSYCKEKVLGQKLRKRELFYGLCHLKLYQFFLVCSYKAEISLAICRIQSHFLGGQRTMYYIKQVKFCHG